MNKTFIYSHNEMTEGLFGQVMLYLLEALPVLSDLQLTPNEIIWDISTKNYGSIFPTVLEYNASKNENEPFSQKINLFELRKKNPQYALGDNFKQINKLFFSFFSIPQNLEEKAQSHDLKDHLGIHFRGTDRANWTTQITPLVNDDFFLIIDSYIKLKNPSKIFLASDEKEILSKFKTKYPGISFKTSRDFNHNLFWRNNDAPERNAAEAMLDMLCLSKCQSVIKFSSALSAFTKVINPDLEIVRINAVKMFNDIPYFPDAYIPLLKTNPAYTDKCNETIQKVQKDEWSINHKKYFSNFYLKPRKTNILFLRKIKNKFNILMKKINKIQNGLLNR